MLLALKVNGSTVEFVYGVRRVKRIMSCHVPTKCLAVQYYRGKGMAHGLIFCEEGIEVILTGGENGR